MMQQSSQLGIRKSNRKKNTSGVLGHPPKMRDNDNATDPNVIVMKLENDESVTIKLETVDTGTCTARDPCSSVKKEIDILIDENNVKESGLNEVSLAVSSTSSPQILQATETESANHSCVWRRKLQEMEKELDVVKTELATVKSQVPIKHRSCKNVPGSSSKNLPRIEDQIFEVERVLRSKGVTNHTRRKDIRMLSDKEIAKLLKHVVNCQAELANITTLLNEGNQNSNKRVGSKGADVNNKRTRDESDGSESETEISTSQDKRTNKFAEPSYTSDWMNSYYTSPKFHEQMQKNKISALLPGVLQVIQKNWYRRQINLGKSTPSKNRVPNFQILEIQDIFNCRLVSKTWKDSVEIYLSNDALFDESKLNEHKKLRQVYVSYKKGIRLANVHPTPKLPPVVLSQIQWNQHFKAISPFTTILKNSAKVSEFLLNFNSTLERNRNSQNPFPNRFLVLKSETWNNDLQIKNVIKLWSQLLNKVGGYIWHLIIHLPKKTGRSRNFGPPVTCPWVNWIMICLSRTPNLKTLAFVGVGERDASVFDVPREDMVFSHLPHLKALRCDRIHEHVINSILRSNLQVEKLGISCRNMLSLLNALNATLKQMKNVVLELKTVEGRDIEDLVNTSAKLNITKLYLHSEVYLAANLVHKVLKQFSNSLTHVVVNSDIIGDYSEQDFYNIQIEDTTFPKLKVLEIITNVVKTIEYFGPKYLTSHYANIRNYNYNKDYPKTGCPCSRCTYGK